MGEGSYQSPGEKLDFWRGPFPAYSLSLEILTCYKLYSTLFNAQCNIDFVNNCDYLELDNNLIRKYTLHCSFGPAAGPRGWAGLPEQLPQVPLGVRHRGPRPRLFRWHFSAGRGGRGQGAGAGGRAGPLPAQARRPQPGVTASARGASEQPSDPRRPRRKKRTDAEASATRSTNDHTRPRSS